jgi:hypothetical protein
LLGALALLLEAALARRGARLRRHALPLDAERFAELLDQPLDRELAVPPLAPLVLRNRPEGRPGLCDNAALLRVAERGGTLDVEDRLDAGLRGVRVLPARSAGA